MRLAEKSCVAAICLFLLFCPVLLQAQSLFDFGINLALGFPQGELKDNVDNIGIGASGFFLYNFPQSPFSIGGTVTYQMYGSETEKRPWSTTIPNVYLDVTTSNNLLLGHILLRVQSTRQSAVCPYVDGLFGFGYFWTETKVESEAYTGDDDNEIARSVQMDDAALSYGFGGGLMIRVFDGTRSDEKGLEGVYIDLGVRYLKGGEATYMKEGDIVVDPETGSVTYNSHKSHTDILTAHIGVSFKISPN